MACFTEQEIADIEGVDQKTVNNVLGLAKSCDILKTTGTPVVSGYSKKTLEELKKLTRAEIRGKSKKQPSNIERLNQDWRKASEKDKEEFLRYIHGSGADTSMD